MKVQCLARGISWLSCLLLVGLIFCDVHAEPDGVSQSLVKSSISSFELGVDITLAGQSRKISGEPWLGGMGFRSRLGFFWKEPSIEKRLRPGLIVHANWNFNSFPVGAAGIALRSGDEIQFGLEGIRRIHFIWGNHWGLTAFLGIELSDWFMVSFPFTYYFDFGYEWAPYFGVRI